MPTQLPAGCKIGAILEREGNSLEEEPPQLHRSGPLLPRVNSPNQLCPLGLILLSGWRLGFKWFGETH